MTISNQKEFNKTSFGRLELRLPGYLSQKFKGRPLLFEIVTVLPVMLVLYLIVFGYLMGNVGITYRDNDYIMTPMFNYISQTIIHGALPLRMDTILGGLPLFNSAQLSWEYPFYFFFSDLYNNPVQSMRGLAFVALFHYLIIYLNTYFLLRVLHLTPLPALLGASLFTFSANNEVLINWVYILAPYSWLPLIMAGAVLIIENKRGRLGLFILAFGLTLLTLAQAAQPLIHAVYLVGILFFAAALRYLIKKEFKPFFDITKNFIFAGVLYLALASPAVIPAFLDMKEMARWIDAPQPLIGNEPIPFDHFSLGSYSINDLNNTLVPFHVPHTIEDSYMGIAVIFLTLLSLFRLKKQWIILPLFLLTLYTLLSVTGENLGLAYLNYVLPLWNKFREPGRHLELFALGSSVLAAFGFDYLCQTLQNGYRAFFNRKHLVLFPLLGLLVVLPLFSGLIYAGTIPLALLYLVGGAGFLVLLILPRLRSQPKIQMAVRFLAILIIMVSATQFYRRDAVLPINQTSFYSAQNQNSQAILQKLAQLKDAKTYRFNFLTLGTTGLSSNLWSMNASQYDLRSFSSFFQPMPYEQFSEMWWQGGIRHYYPLLGNKYFLCDTCGSFPFEQDYHLSEQFKGYSLYVNDQALSHSALISQVGGSYGSNGEFYNIINTGFDYFNQVYIPNGTAPQLQDWLKNNTGPVKGSVQELSDSPTLYHLAVQSDSKSLVLLNEYYTPDWKARVNGQTAQVFRLNLNQIGVLVDKGFSSLEIEYQPALYTYLLWVQVITIALLGLYFIFRVTTKLFKLQLRLPAF